VTEIYIRLRLEQSVASQHLAILRRAGIVRTDRDGKFIYYSVNTSRISAIMHCVESILSQP
ncbi:MAG TPA: ArsR family transcriptional regulator, partial [Chitinophagaceae bacterium]|nr:ArsR family transcriptional regulator [Chitinophagaceae bacterium]